MAAEVALGWDLQEPCARAHSCSQEIIPFFEPLITDKGDVMIRQGDPGHGVYFVMRGHLSVDVQQPDGGAKHVATLHDGCTFGEISCLFLESATATVTCSTICGLWRLRKEKLMSDLLGNPMQLMMAKEAVNDMRAKWIGPLPMKNLVALLKKMYPAKWKVGYGGDRGCRPLGIPFFSCFVKPMHLNEQRSPEGGLRAEPDPTTSSPVPQSPPRDAPTSDPGPRTAVYLCKSWYAFGRSTSRAVVRSGAQPPPPPASTLTTRGTPGHGGAAGPGPCMRHPPAPPPPGQAANTPPPTTPHHPPADPPPGLPPTPPHPPADPPPPSRPTPPPPPPPQVLTDSWGGCRIRTSCSRPPGLRR